MAFTEAINDLSHTDRTNQLLKLCSATWVWLLCGDPAGFAAWEFLPRHMCVCFYSFGTVEKNGGLITESNGKKQCKSGKERTASLSSCEN